MAKLLSRNPEDTQTATVSPTPLFAGSNPAAATSKCKPSLTDQGINQNQQAYSHANYDQGIQLKQAVEGFCCRNHCY